LVKIRSWSVRKLKVLQEPIKERGRRGERRRSEEMCERVSETEETIGTYPKASSSTYMLPPTAVKNFIKPLLQCRTHPVRLTSAGDDDDEVESGCCSARAGPPERRAPLAITDADDGGSALPSFAARDAVVATRLQPRIILKST
jgi:hypothetical protein